MATILIVDDRPENRELVVILLGYAGHRVLEAADGEKGLRVARQERPDLIITDIVMPTMDGYEFARQVRADPLIGATQIVFYSSSYIVSETKLLADACGVSIVVSKPIEPEQFLKTVHEVLESSKPVLPVHPSSEEFHREHMRLLTDTLAKKVDDLEAEVAERKRAEAMLAAGERRFRALIENAPDGIALLDINGRLRQMTPSTEHILGYRLAEAENQDPALLTHPDDLPDLLLLLNDLIQNPTKVIHTQYRFMHKDGSWRWLESTISNLIAEPGVEAILFNYRDITERKRAEEEVQQMRDRFKALTENAPDGVALIDRDEKIKLVSSAARKIFGYGREEELEIDPAEHIHPDDLPLVITALSNLMANPMQIPILQYRFRHRDGSWLWIESTFTNLLTVKNVEAIVMNFRDITARRQAERALLRSERRYRILFEDTPIAIWEQDFSGIKQHLEQLKQDGVTDFRTYFAAHPEAVYECIAMMRILDINKAALQMYQADSKKSLSDGAQRLLSKGEWKNYYEDLICIAEGRTSNSWEGYDETLTGKPIEISLSWSVAPDHEEDFSKVIVTTIDITARTRAEKKIGQQLERLAALREIDQSITSATDVQMSLNVLLSHAQKILGVDAAIVWRLDPVQLTLQYAAGIGFRTDAIQTASVRLGESFAGRVALEQRIMQIPVLVPQRDDFLLTGFITGEGFVSYHGAPLIAKGKMLGVVEVYSRAFVEPDPDWLDFFSTLAGQAAIAIDNAQLFENLQRSNLELEHRVAERTTELSRINAELEHASRAKDEFLANMSHELRTPLNSILGLSESLLEQRRDLLSELQQKSLRIIESSGQHLLGLINDILDLSKIDAGKFDIFPQVFEVDSVCRSSLTLVASQAAKKSIHLQYEADGALSRIYADPRRLKQILVNLLTNAVKFTPDGGQVTLQSHGDVEQDRVQFSVVDTGIGIPPQDLKRLFQPFTQLDGALSRQQEGTGLGLVLVQRLTDLHGGSVQVESEPGLGSQFTINLPWGRETLLRQETPEGDKTRTRAEPPKTPLTIAQSRGTVLLAEDNMANVLTVAEYLEGHGYEVRVAHDGLETIQMAESMNPDIILMDIHMPVMDGLQSMRRLRADPRFVTTPIIALTALAMPGDRDRCITAGANEYMSKPVSLKKLRDTINEMLRKASE